MSNGFNGFSTPIAKGRQPIFTGRNTSPYGVIIPGLAGSPDLLNAGGLLQGSGFSEEFDSTDQVLQWTNPPSVWDFNTTVKSHFYMQMPANTTERLATRRWAPPAALDVRTKCTSGFDHNNDAGAMGLIIMDASETNRILLSVERLNSGSHITPHGYYSTNSGASYSSFSATYYAGTMQYLRVTRDGSNNWTAYYSDDGIGWIYLGGQNLSFTVAKVGFRGAGVGAGLSHGYADWLRGTP